MSNLFTNIFTSTATTNLQLTSFLTCIAVSLVLGFIIAFAYSFKSRYTNSFFMTISLLPAIVSVVIIMVNGQLGAGIAVAGAFSLVRFRSVPGTAKEISTIFLAMSTGLITGMGYLMYGVIFTIIFSALLAIFNLIGNTAERNAPRILKITIPEDLDYSEIFDDLLNRYTSNYELLSVKSTNMGALFKLVYSIDTLPATNDKEFLDALRERNGNLEVMISRQEVNYNEL
jgi:hypothetical protein